jgi:tetratricopeptide (TPR) repeat protein/DNA-binding CsgD family transcriptional regulator
MKKVFISIVTLFLFNFWLHAESIQQETFKNIPDTITIDSLRLLGLRIHENNPDEAIRTINIAINLSKDLNDKIRIAKGLNCLGIAYGTKDDYAKSFELYEKALNYSAGSNDYDLISAIYNNQGNVYQSLALYDLAEKSYLKAIDFLEKKDSPDKILFLNNTLTNLGMTYRYIGNYEKALIYYKRGIEILEKEDVPSNIKNYRIAKAYAEIGMTNVLIGNYDIAENLFKTHTDTIVKKGIYLDMAQLYFYTGKLNLEQKKYAKAKEYLKKSEDLTVLTNNNHLKIEILQSLSKLYEASGEFSKAIELFELKSKLKDSILNSESTWRIYNIKRAYENEKQFQQVELIKKEKEIAQITNTLYTVAFILLILFSIFYIKHLSVKHKKEKKITELEFNKTKDILAVKNKELTTSALKSIEMGEFMKQLKNSIDTIKQKGEKINVSELEKISSSLQNNTKNNWLEFKLRFEEINENFYISLKEKYPTLTSTELKLCSFLKLNFNTKDIASLMGISSESVKVSRYRLRKKFKLTRDVNLVAFISQF